MTELINSSTADSETTSEAPAGLHRLLLALSIALGLTLVVTWLVGEYRWQAPALVGCLFSLLLAARGYRALRRWSFTICILTAVAVALCYPSWFIGVGNFKFTRLFVPILQVIMFCMGTTLSLGDFIRVFRMPFAVVVGLIVQFTIMPFLGLALAIGFGFPPEVGAGIVLVGAVSGGLASNVMAYIATANVALSVTLTGVSTLLAPFMTPLLMKTLAGEMIEIDGLEMMWDLTKLVLIPVIAGLVFHHAFYGRAAWLDGALPLISMTGIIIMTVLTVAVGRDNLLRLGPLLIPACFLHSLSGFLLGYLVCRVVGVEENSCRTIAFEAGMQNAGMAAGIAAELNKLATLGLAPIVFGPVMNTTASVLANWWRTHPARDVSEKT